MEQYRSDRNPADLIFRHRALVHFAVDPASGLHDHPAGEVRTRCSCRSTRAPAVPGRPGGAGNPVNPGGYAHRVPVGAGVAAGRLAGPAGLVRPRRGRVRRQAAQDGGPATLFPRFHQWDAVTQAPGRHAGRRARAWTGWCSTRPGRGSPTRSRGRPTSCRGCTRRRSTATSPTQVKAAGLGADQPIFDKVIVITDRVVLDRQLQATVSGLRAHAGHDRDDRRELRRSCASALEGNTARIIITTLQKFPVVARGAPTKRGWAAVRGHRRRGALVDHGRGDEGAQGASSSGGDDDAGGRCAASRRGRRSRRR